MNGGNGMTQKGAIVSFVGVPHGIRLDGEELFYRP